MAGLIRSGGPEEWSSLIVFTKTENEVFLNKLISSVKLQYVPHRKEDYQQSGLTNLHT
jgi:hypothetical protein